MIQYVKSPDLTTGKKAEHVAKMLEALQLATEPIPFEDLAKNAGAKYPEDVKAALLALEQVEVVQRYTFMERDSSRVRTAYALMQEVRDGPNPSVPS